jgi:hypothetical protein
MSDGKIVLFTRRFNRLEIFIFNLYVLTIFLFSDDPNMYEKAWIFSKEKSGKAQRHWGNYFFDRKRYRDSIPYYQKSCEINSLQEAVWLRLG